MDFRTQYPDYAVIEEQIRRARVERAVAVSHYLAAAAESIVKGIKRLVAGIGRGIEAEREWRSVESDAFLKRSVPRL